MADFVVSLRLIWRARLAIATLWVLLSLVALVLLAQGFSARHPATIAIDVGLSFIRIAIPVLIVVLAQELIGREFDRRYCLLSMTYPRPRHQWLLGRLAAIVLVAFAMVALAALVLSLIVAAVAASYPQSIPVSLGLPFLVTIGLVMVDHLVIAAVATLLAVAARTPVFVLIGSIGFLVIARSYSAVIGLLRQGPDALVEKLGGQALYSESLPLLNLVVPDLGALDVRAIALYGQMTFLPVDWPWHVAGAVAYSLAAWALAAWLLRRREFG